MAGRREVRNGLRAIARGNGEQTAAAVSLLRIVGNKERVRL